MDQHTSRSRSNHRARVAAAVVLLALVLVPAPLLPPSGIVGALQSALGSSRAAAYLVAALGLQGLFYAALGVLSAFAVGIGETRGRSWLRLALVPVVVVGTALLIRSLKLGHVPMLANAAAPMVACALGTALGLALRQHGWRATLLTSAVVATLLAALDWLGSTTAPRRAVEAQLQRLVAAGSTWVQEGAAQGSAAQGSAAQGDARFGRLLQIAFTPEQTSTSTSSLAPVEHNVAAILALGLVIGHERLARYADLDRDSELVRAAVRLRRGTTLREREDWARHFMVSAALAIAENAFISDLGGLLKEEVDSLAKGTGFSFGDLAADRAGVRFAAAATGSDASGRATQDRLRAGFTVADFFPPVGDLAENLTTEQFRRDYDGVGAPRYRAVIADIDARLDRCAALRAQ